MSTTDMKRSESAPDLTDSPDNKKHLSELERPLSKENQGMVKRLVNDQHFEKEMEQLAVDFVQNGTLRARS